jgi:hypothetical protein
MSLEMIFEKIIGAHIAHRKAQAMHSRKQMIFLLIAGPISWLNILNGLRVSEILPSGGGQ